MNMLKTVYYDGWISYRYDIDINDIYLISYHIVSVEKNQYRPSLVGWVETTFIAAQLITMYNTCSKNYNFKRAW